MLPATVDATSTVNATANSTAREGEDPDSFHLSGIGCEMHSICVHDFGS